MKKIITLILLLAGCQAFAQQTFEFKGIKLSGDITRFSEKLEDKGYEYVKRQGDNYAFTGNDTVLGSTIMWALCLPEKEKGTVYGVTETSAGKMFFSEAEGLYKRMQKQLDKAFGEGYYDEYIAPEYDTDEESRGMALQVGKGTYLSRYETPVGIVELNIITKTFLMYVTVTYVDKKNFEPMKNYL